MKKLGFGFMRLPVTDKDDAGSIYNKRIVKCLLNILLFFCLLYFFSAFKLRIIGNLPSNSGK